MQLSRHFANKVIEQITKMSTFVCRFISAKIGCSRFSRRQFLLRKLFNCNRTTTSAASTSLRRRQHYTGIILMIFLVISLLRNPNQLMTWHNSCKLAIKALRTGCRQHPVLAVPPREPVHLGGPLDAARRHIRGLRIATPRL